MPKVLNIEKIGLKAVRAMIASGQAVYIGGGGDFGRYGAWPESKWANEFGDRPDGPRALVIAKYRTWIVDQPPWEWTLQLGTRRDERQASKFVASKYCESSLSAGGKLRAVSVESA
jgi:hypothetical protein